MIFRDDAEVYAVQATSLSDMVHWLDTTTSTWSHKSSQESGGANWNGTNSYGEALRLARDGWEEGVQELFALAATVPNNRVTTKTYSVAGDCPDVGRAVSGDPFNMVRRGKLAKPKAAMTIVAAVGGTSNVSVKEMANFGAALTALIDRLESRNVRVELMAHWGNTTWDGPKRGIGISWTVKRAQDALDLSSVAFSLGHAAMIRRLGFAAMERYRKVIPGYGATRSSIDEALIVDIPEGALLINGVQGAPRGACASVPLALKFATDKINEAARKLGHDDIAELEEL